MKKVRKTESTRTRRVGRDTSEGSNPAATDATAHAMTEAFGPVVNAALRIATQPMEQDGPMRGVTVELAQVPVEYVGSARCFFEIVSEDFSRRGLVERVEVEALYGHYPPDTNCDLEIHFHFHPLMAAELVQLLENV